MTILKQSTELMLPNGLLSLFTYGSLLLAEAIAINDAMIYGVGY